MVALAVVGLVASVAAGCGDDDGDDVEEGLRSAATQVQEGAEDASARTAAEAFAAAVDNDEQAAADGSRTIAVIEENAADLPGDPELTGVVDDDDDGIDDDGLVGVVVGDQESCVELSPDSGEASVQDGPCPG